MSNYTHVSRHPNTHKYQKARWHDNYFGEHLYGVEFDGDPVIYPASQVEGAQLKEFWTADVLVAFRVYLEQLDDVPPDMMDDELVRFLDNLQKAYEARWERDPIDGEGAVSFYFNHKYKEPIEHEEATD